MSLRISTDQSINNSLLNINDAYSRLNIAQQKISSGKQLLKPSDNPVGITQALDFQANINQIDQYTKNLDQAKGFLSTTDTALSSIDGLVQQARTLAVQGANGSVQDSTRSTLAGQIQDIITQIGNIGNSTYGTRYIFAGQDTNSAPFQANGTGFNYVGGTAANGNDKLNLEIGQSESLQINASGDKVITPLLNALGQLRDDISSGATANISQTDIAQLDTQLGSIVNTRADVGSKLDRVNQTEQNNALAKQNLTTLVSNIEDTDIPTAVVALQSAQTAYQAALQSTAYAFQNTLLNYLK